jgi:hypothetical protein
MTENEQAHCFSRLLQRRSSAGGLEQLLGYRTSGLDYGSDTTGLMHMSGGGRRPHSSMSGKLGPARSWHPSPFHSDDDDGGAEEHQFFKEEKKNRIKMEISRRRQQIEENARLHEELIRLAKLRETAEMGGGGGGGHHHAADTSGRLGVLGYPSPSLSPGGVRDHHAGGVLRSVDEILRNDYHSFGSGGHAHGHHHQQQQHHTAGSGGPMMMMSGRNGTAGGRRDYMMMGTTRHSLDDDMLGGTSFNTDRYTSSVYDRYHTSRCK